MVNSNFLNTHELDIQGAPEVRTKLWKWSEWVKIKINPIIFFPKPLCLPDIRYNKICKMVRTWPKTQNFTYNGVFGKFYCLSIKKQT